ncbi:hypothetical protein ST201phi2-1p337 [Pseudomonas phage 201phi2-1]|uniref:Uncharacterized protein n=1 Tax=Pseudomonas phage 201phi2-1 TaxID=198110 RepID=B3FJJ7_BP201|nr:hypothetical protein ST201phi2-1p337 [Pseudomonas phage 201phi2-1]ABY63162.1 hypothetical protein 201phi2-1p337 [Pseudomonas phage 201phi2-1]
MTFNVVETVVDLNYRFNRTYYEHGDNLVKVGNKDWGFTDADIVEIKLYGWQAKEQKLKFYKERNYVQQDRLIFTIFDEYTNLIQTELHVILSEKRTYWRENRETRGRTFPNFSLKLKIIQDPNKKTYVWSGEYWG